MRYSASEKFEIIELVEQSSLSMRRTLAPIGIPRSTFYDWYSRYQEGGIEALVDGKPRPRRIWNKIPDKIETAIVNLALEEPDLSPRELAVNFTDIKGSLYRHAQHIEHRVCDFMQDGVEQGACQRIDLRDAVLCHFLGQGLPEFIYIFVADDYRVFFVGGVRITVASFEFH
jgi:transposase-like protein